MLGHDSIETAPMSLRTVNLRLNTGASYECAFAWIADSNGVDPSTSTPTATFRQTATDPPIFTLTNVSTANGIITFLSPITNFEWVPTGQTEAVLVTLYPVQLSLTVAGVAALYAFQRYSLIFDYPDGTAFPFLEGQVTVGGV
jgi:hypothetical protein